MAFKPKPEPRLPRQEAGSAGRTTRVSFGTQNTQGLPQVILAPPAATMMCTRARFGQCQTPYVVAIKVIVA